MQATTLKKQLSQTKHSIVNKARRDKLIRDFLPFVKYVVGKHMNCIPQYIDREDMIESGILGLVKAADNFDNKRQVQFNTYAFKKIQGSVLDCIREHNLIRIPRNRDSFYKFRGNDFAFFNSDEKEPLKILESKELSKELRDSISKLDKREWTIIDCHYYRNMRVKEIAEIMNLSSARISQLHHGALKKVRAKINKYSTLN